MCSDIKHVVDVFSSTISRSRTRQVPSVFGIDRFEADNCRRIVATAAVAAVETQMRLGRSIPLRLIACRSGEIVSDVRVAAWPDRLRHMPAWQAAQALASAMTPSAVTSGDLLVVLDTDGHGASIETGSDSVRLDVSFRGDGIAVAVRGPDEDPWCRSSAAVSEMFGELLREFLTNGEVTPIEAAGITAESRLRVLGGFAGRAVDNGPFVSIPAAIEAWVACGPDRPAVSYGSAALSYREIDEAANGLAARLTAQGIARGDVVPVVLENGLEMPVAYLALMKLGAAFVPLDPAWPEARISAALDVLAPKLVLGAGRDGIPACGGREVMPLRLADLPRSTRRPAVPVGPDDVIYGIFTSGTTGVPKCAMNLHGGLTNRFRFMTRYFGSDASEVVLQNSKHTFDSSVWQMFWPLTLGGRTVIPVQGEFMDLGATIDTIDTHGVTMTDFVPSIFNMLVALAERDETARSRLKTLRRLIVGGEEITPRTVYRLQGLLPGISITNGYGPTEASIGMVFHTVEPADGDLVPLGRPIDNCYAVILSEDGHLLPPGAEGEIVIGGACLGSGYFGDPGRTGKVFVPNPFPEIPGKRLYHTGDLGCFDAGGRLFFRGRRDFQVKIGGVRIELGEIETAAAACPGVRMAKVLVANQAGRKSLAVFVSSAGDLTEERLRDHLRAVLPRTSLPRHLFILPELPLTDHAKVDRRALQGLLDQRLADDAQKLDGSAAAVTVALGRVLQIFRSTIEKPDLAPDESFVTAGGDSLQALTAVMELEAAFGVRLGVHDLFEHPSAAAMCLLIDAKRAGGGIEEDEATLIADDSALPADIRIASADRTRPLERVFLTGSTGFVGSRVLFQMLAQTDLKVVCLARGENDRAARQRVVSTLSRQGLWRDSFGPRLVVVAGDLGRPRFGLDEVVWTSLARGCDAVLHVGALVNFLFDYRAHRASNVLGTQEILRLAMAERPKPLHHVSTLGVLDCEAVLRGEALGEAVEAGTAVLPHTGYSRSKWVAERLLDDARAKGALVTVFRLGEIMPAPDNGIPNRQALTHFLLASFCRLGLVPDVEMRSDFTPVDYAAARLVAGLLDRRVWGRTMHVVHPESVPFTEVPQRLGLPSRRVSATTFLAAVARAAEEGGGPEIATLCALLPEGGSSDEGKLRAAFEGLLVDNARLFRRDECRALEWRWGLTEGDLDAAMRAYAPHLGVAAAGNRIAANF